VNPARPSGVPSRTASYIPAQKSQIRPKGPLAYARCARKSLADLVNCKEFIM
jgi:hypothetical protein